MIKSKLERDWKLIRGGAFHNKRLNDFDFNSTFFLDINACKIKIMKWNDNKSLEGLNGFNWIILKSYENSD